MKRLERRTNIPEPELLLLLKRGDMHAYRILFERYYMRFLGFTISLVGRKEVAEDLLQEVFLKIWKNRMKINPEQSLKSYIYVIAKNEIFNYFRSHKELLQLPEDFNVAADPEEDKFDASDYLGYVFREVLDKMPPQRRKVFMMNRIQEMTYKDIAAELNISVKTVARHLEIARAEFREFVKKNKGLTYMIGYFILFLCS